MDPHKFLKMMLDEGASDLYFKVGSPPCLRVNDKLKLCSKDKLKPQDTKSIAKKLIAKEVFERFLEEKELDSTYSVAGFGRFRMNMYIQRGTIAVTLRSIKIAVPSFEELNLPVEVMERLSLWPRGLILITGHAGCGKSTTLAAMTDYINRNFSRHIITIEDPIEFLHPDKKSIISQREVSTDTASFNAALRHVIRQAPDVILIGEMRDVETVQIAIMAAETGHLVLSTLHTVDATQTVERIINYFAPYLHTQVRMQFSLLFAGVISMRLIPRCDKPGRVPACEIMLPSPTVRKLIVEGRTNQLINAIEDSAIFKMQSFNQAVMDWYKKGVIDKETALANAGNPDELKLKFADILSGKGTHER
ncbi:MAG: PilT/PilU family type 4a pilus ATPase [Candidatus Omnitrophota bacterium]|nr:MAG: PilT/PilU family type 4a pilus ATPase [Candidatus Omnitrophota bacterium]